MSDSESDAQYFQNVVAEIEAEAKRRSTAGEYPRALLRSLEEEFRRWVPDATLENGVEDTIRGIEAASYIEPAVPIASRTKVGRLVKWWVRRLTFFYHRHITQQITALGIHITRPLRLLDASLKGIDRRLAKLEDQLDVGANIRSELLASLPIFSECPEFREPIREHLRDADGRTLLGDLTDLGLYQFLREERLNVYGVSSAGSDTDASDVRSEDLFTHLGHLDSRVLGGFVLCGIAGRYTANEQLRLLQLLLLRSTPGAKVAVVVPDPEKWLSQVGPVAADMLQGRPLHPDTWVYLLTREHAVDVKSIRSADSSSHLVTATLK